MVMCWSNRLEVLVQAVVLGVRVGKDVGMGRRTMCDSKLHSRSFHTMRISQ